MNRSLYVLLPVLTCVASGCVVKLTEGTVAAPADASAQVVTPSDSLSDADAFQRTTDTGEIKLPPGEWKNVTGSLAGLMSECGDLSGLFVKPNEDMVVAGVALHGLFSSTDGGESWQAMGTAGKSDKIIHRPSALVYDPDAPKIWWVAGIYNGSGVFRTTDNGGTFKAVGDVRSVDTLAIDFGDPARKLLVATGHEVFQTLYRSSDGGNTWSNIGRGLPENIGCQAVDLLDADTYLVSCDYAGEGTYRTEDAGETWSQVSPAGAVRSPLHAADGSIYWARPEPHGLMRSTDQGLTWTTVTEYGVLKAVPPVQLPDGRIAAVGNNTIVVSNDHGAHWQPASARLPFNDANGLVYSPYQKAFFIKHSQCVAERDTVLPDAIMRFDFDPGS